MTNEEALNCSEFPDNSDMVSRQAVLDAVNRAVTKEAARWSIKELPSVTPEVLACGSGELVAEPERKTGRWIDIDSETYTWKVRCDQCGHERSMMSTQGRYPRFCEGCGCRMMEEMEHETDGT